MSEEVESNDQENRRLVFGLLELINKLDLGDNFPNQYGDESLIADLEDAVRDMSEMDVNRGIEILVLMLSAGRYKVANKGEK